MKRLTLWAILPFILSACYSHRFTGPVNPAERSIYQSKKPISNESNLNETEKAKARNGEGQYQLGLRSANGEGVPQDYTQAYIWLKLAAVQGHENALKEMDFIAKKMTPAQIAEAQRLARECLAQHQK